MNHEIPGPEIIALLSEHTDLLLRPSSGSTGIDRPWDLILEAPGLVFLIEYKTSASTEAVGSAIRQIEIRPRRSGGIPLLVVPFMGEVGRDLCGHAGISWLDLAGNARITAPGLRIAIEGRKNPHLQRGRPSDPFAPKASRITRTLLLHPGIPYAQSDLVGATGLDKGFASRVLQRLRKAGLVERDPQGFIHVPEPARLLTAWRAAYDFFRHDVTRAVVAARSGPDVMQRVEEGLRTTDEPFAATGLAAAWSYVPFAAYRVATVYLQRRPSAALMKQIGAREMTAGTNLWLVVPTDPGVFAGRQTVDGLPCVSPLQTYMDLKAHPERADEAAAQLARKYLPWANHDPG
jgi:hypothetical protein